jgi:hypothetical protein
MADEISHEEISKRFLESQSLNFDAIGKFVSEIGPDLLIRDKGLHGVVIGRFNQLACMLTASDVAALVGNLRAAANIVEAMDANREAKP